MGRLNGKVAIITGAGSGMGQTAAVMFAKEGAKIVVADINADAGEKTVRLVRDAGGDAIFVKTDMSKSESIKDMVRAGVKAFGKINVLYNNAAIGEPVLENTVECSEENWDKVQAIDLKGVWLAMEHAIPEILKAGGGSIINVASQAATRGNYGLTAYTAAKGGVAALTRSACIEFAAKHIRVNTIAPGYVSTPMLKEFVEAFPDIAKQVLDGTPQHRFGTREEVAYTAMFLASDEASHITGAEIPIDGGITAWSHTM